MSRIKTMLMAMVAVFAIGAVGASAASAATATTFSGIIQGTTWAGSIGPCGFSIDVAAPGNIGAGQTATAVASSFTGTPWTDHAGTVQPACDTSTTSINADFDVQWGGSDTAASILPPVSITDTGVGCTYTTSSSIGMTSATDVFGTPAATHPSTNHGEWSGSGSASGSGICAIAPANLSVDSGLFH